MQSRFPGPLPHPSVRCHERDVYDGVPLVDPVESGEVFWQHPSENRVLEIEARIVDEIDEELGVTSIAAARREAYGAALV